MRDQSISRSDFYVYVLFRENGHPFYVGTGSCERLQATLDDAKRGKTWKARIIRKMRASGIRPIAIKIREGMIETEAHATEIALISAIGRNPDGPLVNQTDGGEGSSGYKWTAERKAAHSARFKGRKVSPQTLEKLRPSWAKIGIARAASNKARTGSKTPDAVREKQRAAHINSDKSRLARERGNAAWRGKHQTAEVREIIAASKRGKPRPPHVLAALLAANLGRKRDPAAVEKTAAKLRGRKMSAEFCAKLSARMQGWHHPPGSKSRTGRPHTDEAKAKMSAAQIRRREKNRALKALVQPKLSF